MKFNTKNLNPGTFFPFIESKPEKGGVTVRQMNGDKMDEIQTETRTRRFEWRRGKRYEVFDRDEDRENLLFWDYCIVDWTNVEDDDGNPIECTAENKAMLMGGSPQFAAFVADCLEKLDNEATARLEEGPKN